MCGKCHEICKGHHFRICLIYYMLGGKNIRKMIMKPGGRLELPGPPNAGTPCCWPGCCLEGILPIGCWLLKLPWLLLPFMPDNFPIRMQRLGYQVHEDWLSKRAYQIWPVNMHICCCFHPQNLKASSYKHHDNILTAFIIPILFSTRSENLDWSCDLWPT